VTGINPDNASFSSPYRGPLDLRVENRHKDWLSVQMRLYLYLPVILSWLVNTPLLQVF